MADNAGSPSMPRAPRMIAVAVPVGHEPSLPLTDPFFADMISRLADEIAQRGYDMLLRKVLPPSPGWLPRLVEQRGADGVIVVGQSIEHDALNAAATSFRPLVIWGGAIPDARYCTVGTDNFAGAVLAVEHLISIGRRRIVFLGDPVAPELQRRYEGYREALQRAGLPADLVVPTQLIAEGAHKTARSIAAAGGSFDAVFAATDVIAASAARAMSSAGLRVPDDIAIVGFDDLPIAALTKPPLTTVQQDLRSGARLLMELLCRRIEGEDTPSAFMTPRLVIRASTVGAT